jgi:4-alpha-glucanotransferase
VVRDDGLAAAHELSSYRLAHNFGDSLRRYHEHYHDRIAGGPREHQGEGIASAHDIVRFKHPVEAADIVPDSLPRALFIDRLDASPLTDYGSERAADLCFIRPGISKRYAVDGDTLTVDWQFAGLAGHRFSTVLNLAMPSCDGFLGRYVLADGSIPAGFGQPLELADATCLLTGRRRSGRPPATASLVGRCDKMPASSNGFAIRGRL